MKCLADQKLKTRKKTAPRAPPSISLASFSSTLRLSSLWSLVAASCLALLHTPRDEIGDVDIPGN